MKKAVSSLLVLSILSITVPAWAADSSSTKPEKASSLRAAVAQSGAQLALVPTVPSAVKAQSVPTSLPRAGSGRIRKGSAGMVIGLVSTLAGAAGTYYMIKEMKKTTDQAQKQQ